MTRTPDNRVLGAVVALCLAWAAAEARHLDWRSLGAARRVAPLVERSRVEESFADVRADLDRGRTEQALLALRRRAEQGPYPGVARFLLGEVAMSQGAHAEAVRHYRRAVEQSPEVSDRKGPFASGTTIEARLAALLTGPWATERPPEIKDLYYLRRRLGGGCE